MGERLTWQEIKRRYPHQYVGLVDAETGINEVTVKSAVVACTSNDTSYDEMTIMAFHGKITMMYTTDDEELLLGIANDSFLINSQTLLTSKKLLHILLVPNSILLHWMLRCF